MTARVPTRTTEQNRKEEAALAYTIDRLRRQFPDLSEEDVRRAVHGKYTDFEQAPIRDFVPILVENVARGELEDRARRLRV
jgi:hypothetical protein